MSITRVQEEEELRDSLPYHWLKGLAQNEEEEARRRRHVAPPPPPAEALAIHPGHGGGGGRRFFTCRCVDGSMIELEEGERCPPGCNPITQGEAAPIAPFLITIGFIGLLTYAIIKRPFG